MKKLYSWRLLILLILLVFSGSHVNFQPVHAEGADEWWDAAWPYRVAVTVPGNGVAAIQIKFTDVFTDLGLAGALLDLGSLRLIAYQDGHPSGVLPYEETYSQPCVNTRSNDPAPTYPYWFQGVDTKISLGSPSIGENPVIHTFTEIKPTTSTVTWFGYDFNDEEGVDWSDYEILRYEVWPRVNDSAIDQTPDLYYFELVGAGGCDITEVSGPPLVMGRWNTASVSLKPYGNCLTPNLSSLESLRFVMKVADDSENHGYYEPGDEIDLWLDNFRLVDQDNGEIRWQTIEGADRYYIYFDTLNHEGHDPPDLAEIGTPTLTRVQIGSAEAGGYFHQVAGAQTGNLTVWRAPTSEKILQSYAPPVISQPLQVQAARGEIESFQLVVNSPEEQNLSITASQLVRSDGVSSISSDQIEVFRVDYVPISFISDFYGRLVNWPDPLYPVSSGEVINFPANNNQPLWIRIKVPKGTSPGVYHGTISIGSSTIPFSVNVWNFVLPQWSYLDSQFGFDWETVMETYGGTVGGVPQACYAELKEAIESTFEDYRLTPTAFGDDFDPPEEVVLYSLTSYEVTDAQALQTEFGKQVWWQFANLDVPPLPNPAVIDRPGVDARILPWLAWRDRVDGIYYPQMADWDDNKDPWKDPFSNGLSNGDGFFFYPPKDNTIAFNPCDPSSNRLVPSIRLELLREGLEDFAYFWLLNSGGPQIGAENQVDELLQAMIYSRTAFNRNPNAMQALRAEMAELILAKQTRIYLPLVLH